MSYGALEQTQVYRVIPHLIIGHDVWNPFHIFNFSETDKLMNHGPDGHS